MTQLLLSLRFSQFKLNILLLIGFYLSISHLAEARELSIVFSSYTPPYVFQSKTGEKPGILVEIIQQSLIGADHSIKPMFLPLGRDVKLLEEKKVDGVSVSQRKLGLKAHYSDYHIQYHNFAIGLEAKQLPIRRISDLKGRSIIAFQKADTYLGDEFKAMVANNPNYSEMANQENQVHMLLKGRIDIAVMDKSIFQFYRNKLINEGKITADIMVRFYNLFEPSRYRAAFSDKTVRDQFNQGLERLKKSGDYNAIYDKYLLDYFVYQK